MKKQKNLKKENNDFFKNVEKIIIHRYQTNDGTYELKLQNINKVLKNSQFISEEINTNPKYVRIYNKSLKEATKPLKLEELMTQACKKQVEQATTEYKIEIAELKSKDQIKDAKLEASDKEIQQLKAENKIFKAALTKAGLL